MHAPINLTLQGIVIFIRFSHSLKAKEQIVSKDCGNEILVNERHFVKAKSLITTKEEGVLNFTLANSYHFPNA